MTGIRRGLFLTGVTVLVFLSLLGMLPAQASFADSVSGGTTITTGTVAASTNVVGSLACGNGSNPSTMGLTWTASTSARVSGYLVTVYFSDGYTQTVQKPSTATSWSASIATYNVTAYAVRYSVTTQTDYRWTMESARTGWFQC